MKSLIPDIKVLDAGAAPLVAAMCPEKINKLFPDLLKNKPLYVADSALVTETNLKLLKDLPLPFVSRLPNNYGLVEELKNWAFAENKWENLGKIGKQKKAAHYKIQGTTAKLYD